MSQLQDLGVRTVPVVAKGDEYVLGLSLQEVGAFLGLDDQVSTMLGPEELMSRLDLILRAAQRFLHQLTDDLMQEQLPGRPRSYRDLTYHLFQISRSFLSVASGQELTYEKLVETPPGCLVSFIDIADDGEIVLQKLHN